MGLTNFLSVILMILFSALLIVGNAQVTDTDGDPLLNGGKYFIRPQDISVNGGLTIIPPCPYYITRSKDETFRGIPVTISSPFKVDVISPGLPISIIFGFNKIDICKQTLKWQVIYDKSRGKFYVRTGATDFSPEFSIFESTGKSYKIKYNSIENGGEVGFFEKDGLLGVNTGTPLSVVFIKALGFNNGIAMKV